MTHPGTLTWFAQHELRLAWRDWLAMMTAGRRGRVRTVAIALVVFVVFMHLARLFDGRPLRRRSADRRQADAGRRSPAARCSRWSLMMSQAMESVTRAFYARSDLDLILVLAGRGAQSLRGAHRRDGALGDR